jgi:hypothetical protein
MFWKKRRKDVQAQVQAKAQAVADDAVKTATDLAEKSMVIGPTGVILLLGAAVVGAAATYYVAKKRKLAKKD